MSDIDWNHLSSESDRLLEQWENMQHTAEPLSSDIVQGFEYGFELGYRVAKGEEL
jgi:hypothetical protein